MARYGVTFEKVADIANALAAADVNPTVDRVREKLGTGSKSTIAKHLKRWRTQAELSHNRLGSYDPEQIPEALMALMQDFWQSFYRTQVADEQVRRTIPPNGEIPVASSKTSAHSHQGAYLQGAGLENHHALQEQMQLIQDYVVGLEAELAESTALQHRLAHRLSAYYGPDPSINPSARLRSSPNVLADTEFSSNEAATSGQAHAHQETASSDAHIGHEVTHENPLSDLAQMSIGQTQLDAELCVEDLADPELYAMPLLAELASVQAALSRAETAHDQLTADLDWATRSAFDLANTEADLRQSLNNMQHQLAASTVRETALAAENNALKAQISHLRRALALRQRFIERLEGDVLAFRPAGTSPLPASADLSSNARSQNNDTSRPGTPTYQRATQPKATPIE